jgi:CheY-like chemotaxis protein
MTQVLVAGKGWQARTLLRAQLIEEGLDVEAYETVRSALESLEAGEVLPSLIVVDLSASDDTHADVDLLATWTRQIPVWIIASRNMIIDQGLKGRGFEVILFRPVDMCELVDQIKQRMEA